MSNPEKPTACSTCTRAARSSFSGKGAELAEVLHSEPAKRDLNRSCVGAKTLFTANASLTNTRGGIFEMSVQPNELKLKLAASDQLDNACLGCCRTFFSIPIELSLLLVF